MARELTSGARSPSTSVFETSDLRGVHHAVAGNHHSRSGHRDSLCGSFGPGSGLRDDAGPGRHEPRAGGGRGADFSAQPDHRGGEPHADPLRAPIADDRHRSGQRTWSGLGRSAAGPRPNRARSGGPASGEHEGTLESLHRPALVAGVPQRNGGDLPPTDGERRALASRGGRRSWS